MLILVQNFLSLLNIPAVNVTKPTVSLNNRWDIHENGVLSFGADIFDAKWKIMGMKKTHEKRAFILVCELRIIQVWWADKGEMVARWYVCNQFRISKKESCINKELLWLLSVPWAVTSLQNVDDDIPKGTDLLCWKEGAPQRKRWLWKTAHLRELEIPTSAKFWQLQAANGSVSAIVLIFYSILFYSHFLCLPGCIISTFWVKIQQRMLLVH